MYVSTFNKKMPCGRGFEWTNHGNGKFRKKMMAPKSCSLACVQWIDWMNQTDERFVDSNGVRQRIRHGWNSSEVVIENYPVDGYVKVDRETYILQFDGCYWVGFQFTINNYFMFQHVCTACINERHRKWKDQTRNDERRDGILANHGQLIKIKGCEWERIKRFGLPPGGISPFLHKDWISKDDIVTAIYNSKVTGFVLCDIVPTAAAKKYEDINWPPIFKRDAVEHGELSSWLQNEISPRGFPKASLVQSMSAEKILLHTALLEFYLKNGFEVSEIYKFIEYEAAECFKDFQKTLYELRVQATVENNNAKASAAKLTGNAPFGKVSCNLKLRIIILLLEHSES